MDKNARIELVVRTGSEYTVHSIALPVDERLLHELSEPMELSDEPFSLYVAGGHRGRDVTEVRRKMFRMREAHAKDIANSLAKALVDYFGRNDRADGYHNGEL